MTVTRYLLYSIDQPVKPVGQASLTALRDPGGAAMNDRNQGVFAISIAAEMVSMEVQNLRVYERRGLLKPARTPGGTRLYSEADIARLNRIRELLAEGLNLVGISRVLSLEAEVLRLQRKGP
jgi:hypothetical protein